MTLNEFNYWFRGFMDVVGSKHLTQEQFQLLLKKIQETNLKRDDLLDNAKDKIFRDLGSEQTDKISPLTPPFGGAYDSDKYWLTIETSDNPKKVLNS